MPLPASGELSHPDNQDVDMKAYLEALRDEVASLSSQLNTVQIDLEAAEQAIVSNDGDITALEQAIVSDDGDITALEQAIVSNDGDITALQSGKANTSGTYSGLRAQSTTKGDVGLGSVNNYGASSSVASDSTSTYATTALTNDIYNLLPYTAASSTGVGTVILAYHSDANVTITAGSNYSGSLLRAFGVSVIISGGAVYQTTTTTLSGTWKALIGVANGGGSDYQGCMFVRIS